MKVIYFGFGGQLIGLVMMDVSLHFSAAGDERTFEVIAGSGLAIFLLTSIGFILWWLPKRIRLMRTNLAGELEQSEHSWGSVCVQYPGGTHWVGGAGRLFLTDEVLEFRASPGQLCIELLVIPFSSIRRADFIWIDVRTSERAARGTPGWQLRAFPIRIHFEVGPGMGPCDHAIS